MLSAAIGVASSLFSGRLTFAVGVAIGLAAFLAAQEDRPMLGGGLGALTTFASPLAGAFPALAWKRWPRATCAKSASSTPRARTT